MARKAEHDEKLAKLASSAIPLTPFDHVKWYGPLIQEFGIIVRQSGKDSEAALQFFEEHPDFNNRLQLIAIMEHLRGARFTTKFPDTAPSITTSPPMPTEPRQEEAEEPETLAEIVTI